jgi:hypothetical protein
MTLTPALKREKAKGEATARTKPGLGDFGMVFSSLGVFLGFSALGPDGSLGWTLAMGAWGLRFF